VYNRQGDYRGVAIHTNSTICECYFQETGQNISCFLIFLA